VAGVKITPVMLSAGAQTLRSWIDDMPSYFVEQVVTEVYTDLAVERINLR